MRSGDRDVVSGTTVWIAPGASVWGSVHIGAFSSVWYGAVVRGDEESIWIGEHTNVQDNAVIHVSAHHQTHIGDGVTIGHGGAIVHGCTIGDNTLIGMGAIVLDGACVGNDCIIGAGSLVTHNKKIPDGSMAFGSPIRIVRQLTSAELAANRANAQTYVQLARERLKSNSVSVSNSCWQLDLVAQKRPLSNSVITSGPKKEVLEGLIIEVLDVKLTVCKLQDLSKVAFPGIGDQNLTGMPDMQRAYSAPGRVAVDDIVFLAQTDAELSLVCATSRVPDSVTDREDGWRAFRIVGTLNFSLIGILAEISAVLASSSISIFAVSTYNTDYVLVQETSLQTALCALQGAGMSIKEQD